LRAADARHALRRAAVDWHRHGCDAFIVPNLRPNANAHVAGEVNFAVLPGNNADDGTEEQYDLICRATEQLTFPLEVYHVCSSSASIEIGSSGRTDASFSTRSTAQPSTTSVSGTCSYNGFSLNVKQLEAKIRRSFYSCTRIRANFARARPWQIVPSVLGDL